MKIHTLFFSPTSTTRRVVESIANGIARELGEEVCLIDVTTPDRRRRSIAFGADDCVVFGVPVYIGRVPNLIKGFLATIRGGGAIGVPVVVYGNSAYDDALLELKDMMEENGFRCAAAAAFVGEQIARKIAASVGNSGSFEVPGNRPCQFFQATDNQNKGIDIRKAKPLTDEAKCTACGFCVTICPMGAIDAADCREVPGICIKCGACIKRCPHGAKYFADPVYLEHKQRLEEQFTTPAKQPELFI